MPLTIQKPYVIYIAEVIYSYISIIKKKNSPLKTKDAIYKFIESEHYGRLSRGTFHDEWFNDLKKHNYIDQETGNKIPIETIKLLEIQRNATIKQLIKIPNLYDTENNNLTEVSNKAYQFLWRMCESYELWCKETKQPVTLSLNITN